MTTTLTATPITIYIDQEKFELKPEKYTAAQLLTLAGEDPAKTILVLREGHDLKQLPKDLFFEPKPGSHFVVFHCDPTPVS